MKKGLRIGNKISRRGILPLFGTGLLIPFMGFGNSDHLDRKQDDDETEYQTLLKPDGTIVKIKVSTVQKSKVIQKNISNRSFLKWLGKKK